MKRRKNRSLLEKLRDPTYIESLSEKRRRELLFSAKILTEEELSYLSSIDTAYRIARERWIRENIPPEEQEKYLEGKPLFIK